MDCVEDVLEELAPQLGPVSLGSLSAGHAQALTQVESQRKKEEVAEAVPAPDELNIVINQLKASDKLHVDSIIEGSGLNVQTVLKLLLELELNGLVSQHPGKLFSLT